MAPAVCRLEIYLACKDGVCSDTFISRLRHAPYMQGNISSVLTRLLTDVSEPNMKLWSCVSRSFSTILPDSSIEF